MHLGDEEEQEVEEMADMPDNDDQNDLSEEEINRHQVEVIRGQRKDAIWLALDNTWLQVKNSESV